MAIKTSSTALNSVTEAEPLPSGWVMLSHPLSGTISPAEFSYDLLRFRFLILSSYQWPFGIV
jgi:hypothetical protein